ncbi:collagen alpha-1(III) chain-like [Dipodomys spectabilis]|uniref:collagen alpha-1(III) chain-like n=1 Tax=Dipodomys spectabilis TaxID=105255 RepID=UPI001C548C70|nr:collagen alpha-1(III) chain-like [Dipodomys spectabilis]
MPPGGGAPEPCPPRPREVAASALAARVRAGPGPTVRSRCGRGGPGARGRAARRDTLLHVRAGVGAGRGHRSDTRSPRACSPAGTHVHTGLLDAGPRARVGTRGRRKGPPSLWAEHERPGGRAERSGRRGAGRRGGGGPDPPGPRRRREAAPPRPALIPDICRSRTSVGPAELPSAWRAWLLFVNRGGAPQGTLGRTPPRAGARTRTGTRTRRAARAAQWESFSPVPTRESEAGPARRAPPAAPAPARPRDPATGTALTGSRRRGDPRGARRTAPGAAGTRARGRVPTSGDAPPPRPTVEPREPPAARLAGCPPGSLPARPPPAPGVAYLGAAAGTGSRGEQPEPSAGGGGGGGGGRARSPARPRPRAPGGAERRAAQSRAAPAPGRPRPASRRPAGHWAPAIVTAAAAREELARDTRSADAGAAGPGSRRGAWVTSGLRGRGHVGAEGLGVTSGLRGRGHVGAEGLGVTPVLWGLGVTSGSWVTSGLRAGRAHPHGPRVSPAVRPDGAGPAPLPGRGGPGVSPRAVAPMAHGGGPRVNIRATAPVCPACRRPAPQGRQSGRKRGNARTSGGNEDPEQPLCTRVSDTTRAAPPPPAPGAQARAQAGCWRPGSARPRLRRRKSPDVPTAPQSRSDSYRWGDGASPHRGASRPPSLGCSLAKRGWDWWRRLSGPVSPRPYRGQVPQSRPLDVHPRLVLPSLAFLDGDGPAGPVREVRPTPVAPTPLTALLSHGAGSQDPPISRFWQKAFEVKPGTRNPAEA